MTKATKLVMAGLLLLTALPVSAEETEADLGVGNQLLLPSSPFYFLKQARRRVQEVFTFNPVKKLELKQKFAIEVLAETQQLVQKGKSEKVVEKSLDRYEKIKEQLGQKIGDIKEEAKEAPEMNSFVERLRHQEEVQNRVLDQLETQVPEPVMEKIRSQRQKHLKNFEEVMMELQERVGEEEEEEEEEGEIISGTGTITKVELEGGFYGIVTENGEKLDPQNLPEEFKEDGLEVRFKASVKQNAISIRMWGQTVTIEEIETTTEGQSGQGVNLEVEIPSQAGQGQQKGRE